MNVCRMLCQVKTVEKITLYFMIGLPGENDSEVLAIPALVKQVCVVCSKPVELTVSVMIPDTFTRLESATMIPISLARRRWQLIQDSLDGCAKISPFTNVEMFYLNRIFARGNRGAAEALIAAVRLGLTWDSPLSHWLKCLRIGETTCSCTVCFGFERTGWGAGGGDPKA